MKKLTKLCPALALSLVLTGCSNAGRTAAKVIMVILAVCALALAVSRTYHLLQHLKKQRKAKKFQTPSADYVTLSAYVLALLLLLAAFSTPSGNAPTETTGATEPSTQETTEPPVLFTAAKTTSSDPSNWGINWEIFVDGQPSQDFTRTEGIFFETPEDYFALPGIATFRGNAYRNSPTYGTAQISEKTLTLDWTSQTGVLEGATWSGSGWTGQPLMVQWDAQTRANMNLYPEKQNKDSLVEVIYATLDGHIYFLDLDDGSATRAPINIGQCFKGAGALDPRGYPLLYVGSGDVNSAGERPRMYIISLIDGSVLYTCGDKETLSLRQDNDRWCAFDSSPLVHGDTDTLIWPGESGILYTMTLNTQYDPAAGTISVNPDNIVTTRYSTARSTQDAYWYGYEASANIVENYLYVSENGGMFYCVDLNTMELVWAQDTADDSNCTPVFERTGEDAGFIYTAPSLHWTRDANMQGAISLYKLDATTGQIVWQKPYKVHTVDGVSGGVQSTPALGKEGTNLEGLIFYTIARTPEPNTGILVALDTQTGAEVWRMDMDFYAWSSPVAVYDAAGNGYVVACDSNGTAFFLDGKTGQLLDTEYLGGLIEATPAVYENTLVVGTRTQQICGVKIQ
jgi:outer membrane protein assembly factor BamB